MATITTKPIRRALVSVYYKDGLEPILRRLAGMGVELISTGGTFAFIQSLGLAATRVETLTGFPSVFGGRVKTLHPAIFGGILQRRGIDAEEADHHQILPIDLVIVNLYPFEETVAGGASHEEIVEQIDIGGISLIRAAAKNFKDVVVISSPEQYESLEALLPTGGTELPERKRLALEAFANTSAYDMAIVNYFLQALKADGVDYMATYGEDVEDEDEAEEGGKLIHLYDPSERLFGERGEQDFSLSQLALDEDDLELEMTALRYGENPHQDAEFEGSMEAVFTQLHGRELSYNNLLDLDAALHLVYDFLPERDQGLVCCAIIKHNNACGLALAPTAAEAWERALAADPISAFGGVVIFNAPVDEHTARQVDGIFFEILAAPAFSPQALEVFKSKKNRILLQLSSGWVPGTEHSRSALGGYLHQQADLAVETEADLRVVTKENPTPDQIRDLLFAARICKHTKSNAIILARDGQLLASGTGQTSRIDALHQAIVKAKGFNFVLEGAVMASDAFFPFPDCVSIAHQEGIAAIIQPGGSVKDQDSIQVADAAGMAMVFSGRRHFKH